MKKLFSSLMLPVMAITLAWTAPTASAKDAPATHRTQKKSKKRKASAHKKHAA